MANIDIYVIAAYLILTFVVGLYYGSSNKSLKDFALGGQGFSTPVLVATIFATLSGANTVLGTSERMYVIGMIFVLIRFADPLSKLVVSYVFLPYFEKLKAIISVGDLLEINYKSTFARKIGGIAVLLKCTASVSAQLMALSLLLSNFTDLNNNFTLAFVTIITILYSTYGGVRSVLFTDAFQFVVIIIAIPIVSFICIHKAGGYEAIFQKSLIIKSDITKNDILDFSLLFLFSVIPTFNPVFFQRLILSKSIQKTRTAINIAALTEVPINIIIALLVGAAFVINPNIEANRVFPFVVNQVLPAGVKGLAIAGLFALIMSTVDSFLNTGAVHFVRDIVSKSIQEKSRTSLYLTKIATMVIGTVAYFIAIDSKSIFNLYILSMELWTPLILIPLWSAIFQYKSEKYDFLITACVGSLSFYISKYWYVTDLKFMPLILSISLSAIIHFRRVILRFLSHPILNLRTTIRCKFQKIRLGFAKKKLRKPFFLNDRSEQDIYLFSISTLLINVLQTLMTINSLGSEPLPIKSISILLSALILISGYYSTDLRKKMMGAPLFLAVTIICYVAPLSVYAANTTIINSIVAMSLCIMSVFLMDVNRLLLSAFTGFFCTLVLCEIYLKTDTVMVTYRLLEIFLIGLLLSVFLVRLYQSRVTSKVDASILIASKIAHEIRTPLQSINFLIEGVDNKDLVKKIRSIIHSLFMNVNTFLTTVKKKDISIHLEKISLHDLMDNFQDNFPFDKSYPKDLLKINIEKNLEINADRQLMVFVLINIVKNAFEARAPIKKDFEIQLSMFKKKGFVIINIEDNGIGIPYEDLMKIFSPFYTTKSSGIGIGLPFVSQVVEAMGGQINCESVQGSGTVFSIKFKGVGND